MKVWIAHEAGRELLGEVPPGVEVEVYQGGPELPAEPAKVRFWVPPFGGRANEPDLLARLAGLEAI